MGKTAIRKVCEVSLEIPAEEQKQLHNRWHPDIPFAGKIGNDETVRIECVCLPSFPFPFPLVSTPSLPMLILCRLIGRVVRLVCLSCTFASFHFLDDRETKTKSSKTGNNDSADDMKNVDLTRIHYLSGPFEIADAEPGDVLLVEIMDVQPMEEQPWGL